MRARVPDDHDGAVGELSLEARSDGVEELGNAIPLDVVSRPIGGLTRDEHRVESGFRELPRQPMYLPHVIDIIEVAVHVHDDARGVLVVVRRSPDVNRAVRGT